MYISKDKQKKKNDTSITFEKYLNEVTWRSHRIDVEWLSTVLDGLKVSTVVAHFNKNVLN